MKQKLIVSAMVAFLFTLGFTGCARKKCVCPAPEQVQLPVAEELAPLLPSEPAAPKREYIK